MVGNKCKISLHSSQKMGGDREVTEESYEGTYIERGQKKYISYKRSTEDGEIDCLISFNRKSMNLTQKGMLNSKLELIPGKETSNVYGTPMGNLNLAVYTRHYQVVETQDSVKLIIDYDIVTGTEPIETSMDILVTF
ncbi:MAG: DUF1934 domain-containing protein [Pseudobutyrivibrio sp.]|nr:DUF1934 domain-containing protein [Pseudobutyrivibrio sp.]